MLDFLKRHGDTIVTLTLMITAFIGLTSFINQRFEAQNQYINARFDAMDQRFEAQNQYMNVRFDTQDKPMDSLEANMNRQFDRLTDEVSELRKLTVHISERVSRNEGAIEVIRERLHIADQPTP